MADTTAQLKAEKWIVTEFLPRHFRGISFASRKMPLRWGGKFDFDAVSTDGDIVGLISTSSARTGGGNLGTAKIQKLKCDTLYLLHVMDAQRLLLIFTEQSMLQHFEKEKRSGRFPPEVEFIHAPLPTELHNRVLAAQRVASAEVSPFKI